MSATTPGLVGGRAAAGARRRRNSSPITTPNEAFPSPTTGACSRSCPGKLPVRISWRTILAKGENFRAAFRGFDQFVYMAAYGAKLAAKNALNSDSLCYDNGAIPAIVLTDPQVASVGLTEAAARTAGYAVRVSTNGLDQVPPRTRCLRHPQPHQGSSPTSGAVAYSARISSPRKAPTVFRPRRSRSGRGLPSTISRTRSLRTSRPSKA